MGRLVGRGLQALPPGSPLRRRLLQQVVVMQFELFTGGQVEPMLAAYHPGIEMRVPAEMQGVGFDARYHGYEGLRRFTRAWGELWSDLEMRPVSVDDHGDLILCHYRMAGRGTASGAAASLDGHMVWRLAPSDGRVVDQAFFTSREEALAEAGLRLPSTG